jgi:hypothetical protein
MAKGSRLLGDARVELEKLLGRRAKLGSGHGRIDAALRFDDRIILVETRASASSAQVADAGRRLLEYRAKHAAGGIPVVAVPFMGPVGQELCRELGVSWLDLSGNADIRDRDLLIHVEGRPNRFKARGRPSSVFAPKSSRVARVLLADIGRPVQQRDLVRRTGLGPGYVSRTLHRLEGAGYVARDAKSGRIDVREPDILLRDWRAAYDFERHEIVRGHVAVTGDEELLAVLDWGVRKLGARYAATGLAAAWILTSFAGFRLVTLFVERRLTGQEESRLGFRRTERGANTWIVVPNDAGVFYGANLRRGAIPSVHPVQAYLDLGAHPERSSEAAEAVRERFLSWSRS